MTGKQYVSPLSPEQVEGPYYSNGGEPRSDIREEQDGVTLTLSVTVIDGTTGKQATAGDTPIGAGPGGGPRVRVFDGSVGN